MKIIKLLLNLLKIAVWLVFTALVAMLYAAFYSGFFQAIQANDPLNYLLMSPFIGVYALVHYLVLLLINRLFYHDEFFGFGLFPALKSIGGLKGFLIGLVAIALGIVSAVAVAALHIYFTLVVFAIVKPRSSYKYTPTGYSPSYTPTYTPSTYQSTQYTSSSVSSSSNTSTSRSSQEAEYDFDAYKRYITNNLSASSIYVNAGYSKFVRSAKVTSLSLSFSKSSSPRVSANATVTVYVDNYAVRQYIGTDSHHNSTYANSNVVDSEISSALSNAKSSAQSEIESKIRSLTRAFASQYGGPSSVNESAYVSARKVQ